MSILKKIGLFVILPLVVIFVALTFMAGSLIRAGVESEGPAMTKSTVELDGVSMSLLGGEAGLDGLRIGNPEGFDSDHAFNLGGLRVKLDPASLMGDEIIIHEIVIDQPDIIFEQKKGLGSNLQVLQKNIEAYANLAPTDEETGEPLKMVIEEVYINGAKVTLASSLLSKEPITVDLPDLHLSGIGSRGNGVVAAEAIGRILGVVADETSKKAVQDQLKQKAGGIFNKLLDKF